jgi:2-polyprenyl-3-methyl-5-hydroxy-6-metoxy-1,4-benzoquinol methylase
MALEQHSNIRVRFQQQVENARTYLLPFIEGVLPVGAGSKVMEIGCGEGGVLSPFADKGAFCLGVDLSEGRIRHAQELMQAACDAGQVVFRAQNVYDPAFLAEWENAFDLIILKDTIEHIPDQESFIPYLESFLRPGGRIFFGFPPWRMPFGGHQQICKSKFLGLLPYYHLLPRWLYGAILRMGGESARTVEDLMEIKDTGISLNRFKRILKKNNFLIERETLYLFNPIYRYKFGLTPRRQASLIAAIPWFRDFVTTAGWFVVRTGK